jgi:hypothetical protein
MPTLADILGMVDAMKRGAATDPAGTLGSYARGAAGNVGDMLDMAGNAFTNPVMQNRPLAGPALRDLLGSTGTPTEQAGGLLGLPTGSGAKLASLLAGKAGAGTGLIGLLGAINPREFKLPVNKDGMVTLYHATTKDAAHKIMKERGLRSAGERDVYLSSSPHGIAQEYGDGTVVSVKVDPKLLNLNDEFPGGRYDFTLPARSLFASVKDPKIVTMP